MKRLNRPVVIILLIAISFGIAFGFELAYGCAQNYIYPVKYYNIVEKYADEYNIPEYVILAIIDTESGFDPGATSSSGAQGLMQMLPKTFDWLTSSEHLDENLSSLELYEPETSIKYGTYYLRYLFDKFGNWDTVYAAYNGGEGNVARWLADTRYSDGNGNLINIPDEEPRNYVKKVNKAVEYYKNTYYKNEEGIK